MKTKIPVRKGKRNKIKFFKCNYENTLEKICKIELAFREREKSDECLQRRFFEKFLSTKTFIDLPILWIYSNI